MESDIRKQFADKIIKLRKEKGLSQEELAFEAKIDRSYMSRIERVNQQVKREISRIIQLELSDPRLEFVSITGVEVSKDLRNARVYFSVLGDESRVEAAATGLNGAGGTIRGLLSKKLNMRNTPELRFYHDKSIEYSSYVEETLKEINDEHNSDQ